MSIPDFDLLPVEPLDLFTLAAAIVDHRDDDRAALLVRFACLSVAESAGKPGPSPIATGVLAAGRARVAATPRTEMGATLTRATKASNQVYFHVYGGGADGASPSSPAAEPTSSPAAG